MPEFVQTIAQGAATAWFLIPGAMLLGALHGLEPGHPKTDIAAFIVAIRGTVRQAVLLGVAATISHIMAVWAIAFVGLYFYQGLDAERMEPYFRLLSAAIVIGLAVWKIARAYIDRKTARAAAGHLRRDGPRVDLGHALVREINTGHGAVRLEIFRQGTPPRWRFNTLFGDQWPAEGVSILTERPGGSKHTFSFVQREGFLESAEEIPEPHEFLARVKLYHANHGHDYDLNFVEERLDDALQRPRMALELATGGYLDPHQLAHANDIRRRFSDSEVTRLRIVLFGLNVGWLPSPAAITVLLICLQLKEITLSVVTVLCFSLGLAIALVTVGAVAAVGSRRAARSFPWLSKVAARAPYLSGALVIMVGLCVGYSAAMGLVAGPAWIAVMP